MERREHTCSCCHAITAQVDNVAKEQWTTTLFQTRKLQFTIYFRLTFIDPQVTLNNINEMQF